MAHSCPHWTGIPTPLVLGVGGKICTRAMTCDFCVGWSPAQWELFAKKRTYAERKRSRPSGSVPPTPKTSPRARTSSEVTQPGTSSSSSSKQVKGGGGGGLGVHLVLRPVGLPLLPLDLGPARGVEVCLVSLVARRLLASAPLSLQLLRELWRGRLLVRSGCPVCAASLVASPRSSQHALRRCESLLWSAPVRDPPVFPNLRVEEQGRITEPILGRTALAIAPVILALALLTARGQVVKSVGGGSRLDRCPPANGRDVIGLGLRTTPIMSRSL